MKVGVIKIGARINFPPNSGNAGEAVSLLKMLHLGGAEVHVFTKILKKDILVPDYTWHNIEEDSSTSNLDMLVVINGSFNMYGGVQDVPQILNYCMINKFSGPVFYIYCDPELTLKQAWPSIAKKAWAGYWSQSDIEITRKDICYISQPYDVEKVKQNFNQKEILPAKVVHYPLHKFPLLNPQIPLNEKPEVDLSYGGTFRGGKRIDKMTKYYFGHEDISVEMFGKISAEDFAGLDSKFPAFTGSVKYDEMLPKMNKSLSHCVIGDDYYSELQDIPQRASESLIASVVTFIDIDLDKNQQFYSSNKDLAYFLYVSERKELSDKIKLLKSDPSLRKSIIGAQFDAMKFDPDSYCKDFVNLIKENT